MRGSKGSSIARQREKELPAVVRASADGRSSELRLLIQRLEGELSRVKGLAACAADQTELRQTIAEVAAPPAANLPHIVEELIAAKRADGMSRRYLETIRSHLHRFAAAFASDIAAITTKDIERWVRSLTVGGRTRNNLRNTIVLLFRYARRQGYLPKGQATEADDVARAKDRGGEIGILRPDDLAHVLRQAQGPQRLFIALGAFTGMRSSEMLRLSWTDINLERRFITVAAEKSKTATRRLVPIHPNLFEWLTPFARGAGPLFKGRRVPARAIALAKACGVEWPPNALRHSYATYRLAITANAARVALEMGNSPQKLMSNYRELADEREAQDWFQIVPNTVMTA